jgi:hypothetical protein
MATIFSGGRSRSTRREPSTMGKQLILYFTFLFFLFVFVSAAGQYNVIWTGTGLPRFRFGSGTVPAYATFSNISAISWRPFLVVEEAGVPGENHRPWASNWLTLSLAAASRVHLYNQSINQSIFMSPSRTVFLYINKTTIFPVCH